ncbi:hypothetical protein EVAR_95464_1 [Eumeta japonica]|uniref:Uncharacterized protein n=1 Tax=Eumeta variegata TaxID=151549 RepID=A0A4C1UIP0_EUMVA|nr:hypothetical protein EVAR_95464_1 [Eumeta japonica]
MDDPPDNAGQPPTNVLPSLLALPSPASFAAVSDATTMFCSEDKINKKKRLSKKRATLQIKIVLSFQKLKAIEANFYSINTLPLFNYSFKVITSKPRILLDFGILKDDPSADLHFRSIIENGWLGWHTGVGTFHSQYKIVQNVRCPPEAAHTD